MSYGPFEYNYITKIKSPSEAGVTADGNVNALKKDVAALFNYADLLWTGSSNNGNLKTNKRTLGDAYFYETPQDCTIQGTNTSTKRFIYIDNVPKGFISKSKGLLPGIIEDMGAFNPSRYISDVLPIQPECINVSLEVIDNNQNSEIKSHYMALSDVRQIDACNFPNKINPAFPSNDIKYKCQQGFKNINESIKSMSKYIYLIIFLMIIIFLFIRYH